MIVRTKALVAPQPEIEYPDSDGLPMGETGIHVLVILDLFATLRHYYRGNPMVATLANMFLYYVEDDPWQNVAPDVFVVLDVPAHPERPTFKVWEEGKAPDLVVEVTSRKTRREDQVGKFQLYRDVLKVREYFLFDPLEEYLEPSLQGFRLVGRRYAPIPAVAGRLPSKILGLHLERDGHYLRLYNPQTRRWIPTPAELAKLLQDEAAARRQEAAARRRAEAGQRQQAEARRRAEAAQHQAESEAQRLRRELEKLKKKSKSS